MRLQHRRQAKLRAGANAAVMWLASLVVSACTIGPLRISFPSRATPVPPIVLKWCDQASDLLCVLGFGLAPPDEMIIMLVARPGLPADLQASAAWNEADGSYPCEFANVDGTILSCQGPVIPLGSSVRVEVMVKDTKTLIASGNFVINGMALPTVAIGAQLPPTDIATITPRSTRTPNSGTPYPNPSPRPLP